MGKRPETAGPGPKIHVDPTRKLRRLSLTDSLSLTAKAAYVELHDVAGLQVRHVIVTQRDPGGCAGIDDVTWLEHHELADVPNVCEPH